MARCRFCNDEFKPTHTGKGFYCSTQCQQDYQFYSMFYEFLKGGVYSHDPRWLRQAVVERDGRECSVCRLSEWNDQPIPLELEHKDGNSENHAAKNLCMICPNCHAQTPTYKAKNKGKGRYARRVRYAAGKSF